MIRSRSCKRSVRPWLTRLEDRLTPTLTTTFDQNTCLLTVSSDASDSITLAADTNDYATLNGSIILDGTGGKLRAEWIPYLKVNGGPGVNVIDASGVTAPRFPGLAIPVSV